MNRPVRVRYAPSPTGAPHVGNIRTALFNWLFARHTGGTFIVRIEDTDVARTVPGAVEAILDGLSWLGLDWEEGPEVGGPHAPYFQSRRLPVYQGAAKRLIASGHAYECYCPPERLEAVRQEQQARKEPPRYDRHCRDLSPEERDRAAAAGQRPVVRFKIPLRGETTFHDLLRGEISFDNVLLDDFVMLKSDGYPTYHLANVVDDYLMQISHVIRGEEWISSTPKHVLLYDALGQEPPIFAHLSLILGPDRSKLSKRHGATTVGAYREQGYLPEALFNFLTLLGWAPESGEEIFSAEEATRQFALERVGVTPAIFNLEKLDWMNGVYIRRLSPDELADRLIPLLERHLPPEVPRPVEAAYVAQLVPLIQERLKRLGEAAELTEFFFSEHLAYDRQLLVPKGLTLEQGLQAAHAAGDRLRELPEWNAEALEQTLRPLAEELSLKTGQLFGLLRVAVTGRTVAPPLFQTMEVLGRERTLHRVDRAIELLASGG